MQNENYEVIDDEELIPEENEEINEEESIEEEKEDVLETETSEEEKDTTSDASKEEDTEIEEEVDEKERKKRAYFAALKRKRKEEQKEALEEPKVELDEALKEAEYVKGAIAACGGINPYTKLPVEDISDVRELEEMREAEKLGFDPKSTVDMITFRKEKNKKVKEAEVVERKRQEFIASDKEEFLKKHPELSDDDFISLLQDETMNILAKGRIGVDSLEDIYNDYKKIKKQEKVTLEKQKKNILKKKVSSPGPTNNTKGAYSQKTDYKTWLGAAIRGTLD